MYLDDYARAHVYHIDQASRWHKLSVEAEQAGTLVLAQAASAASEFHGDVAEVAAAHGVRLFGADRFDEACAHDGQVPGQGRLVAAGAGMAAKVVA